MVWQDEGIASTGTATNTSRTQYSYQNDGVRTRLSPASYDAERKGRGTRSENNLNVSDFLLWVFGQYGTAFMYFGGSTARVDCAGSP